ncbi:MAG: hypothetical protein HYU64_17695 [Armatimonadetes bacterium]|nr:hypothetical protein [Armatimonadota bacterium]
MKSPVQLAYKFSKGEERKYKTTTSMVREVDERTKVMQKQASTIESELAQKVIEVEGDGSAHLVTHLEVKSQETDGRPLPTVSEKQTLYFKMDPTGRILEVSGMSSQGNPAFPLQPVQEGDSWKDETTINLPFFQSPQRISSTYTLEEIVPVNGFECARIKVATDEAVFTTMATMEVSGAPQEVKQIIENQGTIFFAHKEGVLVRSDMNTRAVARVGEMVVDTTTNVVMELVS